MPSGVCLRRFEDLNENVPGFFRHVPSAKSTMFLVVESRSLILEKCESPYFPIALYILHTHSSPLGLLFPHLGAGDILSGAYVIYIYIYMAMSRLFWFKSRAPSRGIPGNLCNQTGPSCSQALLQLLRLELARPRTEGARHLAQSRIRARSLRYVRQGACQTELWNILS